MSSDWRARSKISIDDPSLAEVNNFASILVQEAYLTDLVEDPPTDESSMRQLLAAVYESSELNIFHEVVEVMAYFRRPGPVKNEPDSIIYSIRYRRTRNGGQ
jgi:F0F1-type ATP synthase delta subunit